MYGCIVSIASSLMTSQFSSECDVRSRMNTLSRPVRACVLRSQVKELLEEDPSNEEYQEMARSLEEVSTPFCSPTS